MVNTAVDVRHARRGFTADEMTVLLAVTREAPRRWSLDGEARAVVYAMAFGTGLRRNEIRTLTARSFDLDADPPTVTVRAAYSKHRREDVQPIPAELAELLRGFLATADRKRPFPLTDKTAVMLRQDVRLARSRWIRQTPDPQERRERRRSDFLRERDANGLVLDFHSFRHGYVTAIAKAPVSPRVMMALARHSDPRLTMARYSRVGVQDTATALAAIPRLTPDGPDARRHRATGTCDDRPDVFGVGFAMPGPVLGESLDVSGRSDPSGALRAEGQ